MKIFITILILFALNVPLGFADDKPSSAPPPQANNAQQPTVVSEILPWFDYAKDVAQVIFWVTLGAISILTYRRAKKTILQPIRTEIFKVQLEEMRTILSMFVGKDELELRHEFGLDKLFRANTLLMYDNYASTFFDIKVNREERLYSDDKCPSSLITEEGMTKYFELADSHTQEDETVSEEKKSDPRVRAALWAGYTQYQLCIPREFSEQEKKIKNLLENPLLPSECVTLLNEYTKIVHNNLVLIRKILTEGAKEMPDKYPSFEKLKNSSFDWLNHRYADEFIHLKPVAENIISFVRSCYDVDNLLQA